METLIEEEVNPKKRKRRNRGKENVQRKRAQNLEEEHARIAELRQQEMERRSCDIDEGAITPVLFNTSLRYPNNDNVMSDLTKDFYLEHKSSNHYLEVRSGKSIANPKGNNGQKSVWSKRTIPAQTLVCPYVGVKSDSYKFRDRYVVQVDKDVYISACDVMYDVGYLLYMDDGVHSKVPCPMNYGRYINTISLRNRKQYNSLEFNCVLELDENGYDEVWVRSNRSIPVGTELLIDYGKNFIVK